MQDDVKVGRVRKAVNSGVDRRRSDKVSSLWRSKEDVRFKGQGGAQTGELKLSKPRVSKTALDGALHACARGAQRCMRAAVDWCMLQIDVPR